MPLGMPCTTISHCLPKGRLCLFCLFPSHSNGWLHYIMPKGISHRLSLHHSPHHALNFQFSILNFQFLKSVSTPPGGGEGGWSLPLGKDGLGPRGCRFHHHRKVGCHYRHHRFLFRLLRCRQARGSSRYLRRSCSLRGCRHCRPCTLPPLS